MRNIVDYALARKRATLCLLMILVITGFVALITIPKEADPDVQIPIVYVVLSQAGLSPADSERLLVRPTENILSSIEGIKELNSTSRNGGGSVVMEFWAGHDIDIALEDVRLAIDTVKTEFPDAADEPSVHEVNLSLFPIITITLGSNLPERTMTRIADDLATSIETIPAVLEANVSGTLREQVEIILNPDKLVSYGIQASTVLSVVSRNNRAVSAGTLDTGAGRFSLRVPGLYTSSDDLLNLPLRTVGDQTVRVRDVATVRSTFADPSGFVRVDGRSAVSIQVSKRIGTNIVDTIDQVKELVRTESETWPPGISYAFLNDRSTDIRRMLSDLGNSVVSSILLVVILLIAVIGARAGVLVGIAIPSSLFIAFLVLNGLGFTVNIVVLFSLILSVGLLVDGSIVMTEFADRKMAQGATPEAAFREASHRMFWPITSSTATTLCAFLPLIFWPGIVGQFMRFLPITQIIVLTAALAMALIFLPTIGSIIGRPNPRADNRNAKAVNRGGDLSTAVGLMARYLKMLRFVVRRPSVIVLSALALMVGAQVLYGAVGKGVEFFPSIEPDRTIVRVHARGNLSIAEMDLLTREVEREILDLADEKGEMHSVYVNAGDGSEGDSDAEDVVGAITIEFVDWYARRPATLIAEDIRERTAHLAGVTIEVESEQGGPPGGKPIRVILQSSNPELLAPAARKIAALMADIEEIQGIDNGLPPPELGWDLIVDRVQAEKFGADQALIGDYVRLFTAGLELAEFRPDHTNQVVDIVARMPLDRRNLSQLENLQIPTDQGIVPLSSFVELRSNLVETSIKRSDRLRTVEVTADTTLNPDTGRNHLPSPIQARIEAAMPDLDLPSEVRVSFRGDDEDQAEASAFLGRAFLIAMALMGVILVTQFNSFFSALLILSAVIMSTTGVMLGLVITGQPFGIVMCGIGVIALAGIIVNNNIVLIDAFDTLREQGEDDIEAIIRAGAQRMRPVLLTAITTILGLMPLVLRLNIDFIGRDVIYNAPSSQWWAQLSTVIVFGLLFATPLTLLVTPAALVYRTRIDRRARLRRERRHERGLRKAQARLEAQEGQAA